MHTHAQLDNIMRYGADRWRSIKMNMYYNYMTLFHLQEVHNIKTNK